MFYKISFTVLSLVLSLGIAASTFAGVTTANGWHEEEEIYYINGGIVPGVTEKGNNQIYLIGGDRYLQAQVVLFIPGQKGYSPHWNVNIVHTAEGVILDDIIYSSFVSSNYPEALFDDVEDLLGAEKVGLITIDKPGIVVLCPILSEEGASSQGNVQLPEDFQRPWPNTF